MFLFVAIYASLEISINIFLHSQTTFAYVNMTVITNQSSERQRAGVLYSFSNYEELTDREINLIF